MFSVKVKCVCWYVCSHNLAIVIENCFVSSIEGKMLSYFWVANKDGITDVLTIKCHDHLGEKESVHFFARAQHNVEPKEL